MIPSAFWYHIQKIIAKWHKDFALFFLICYLCFWCHIQKIIAKSNDTKLLPYVFFKECYSFTFRSLVHFELIFIYSVRKSSTSFFCMWMFSFPSTILWKDHSFPLWMVLASLLKINWPYIQGIIFRLSLFYFIGLYAPPHARTTLF